MTSDVTERYDKAFYKRLHDGVVRSADVVVPIALELVPAKSVVDIGCGEGAWLAAFQKFGAKEVLGLDGEYVDRTSLFIPSECFRAVDLSRHFSLERTFDLAVSLEVAEHLPQHAASTFVESLARLAPAILFSAAIPFQGGVNHVNEQWPEYWARLFQVHGFVTVDAIRKRVWQDERVEWWYAQNILLFVRPELLTSLPRLRVEFDRTNLNQLRLVHPGNYSRARTPMEPEAPEVRGALRLLLNCIRRGVSRRVYAFVGNRSRADATKNSPSLNVSPEGATACGAIHHRYDGRMPPLPGRTARSGAKGKD